MKKIKRFISGMKYLIRVGSSIVDGHYFTAGGYLSCLHDVCLEAGFSDNEATEYIEKTVAKIKGINDSERMIIISSYKFWNRYPIKARV